MAFNNLPYADLNITNLDWLFAEQKNLKAFVNQSLTDFAQNYLDKVYINARYSAETETLTLYTETNWEAKS